MHQCPRNNSLVDYYDCMMCVNDNITDSTCGACEDVKNGTSPFSCSDCSHPGCIFSGNKEIPVCYNCKTTIEKKSGYWKKIKGADTLFCSKVCGDSYSPDTYPTHLTPSTG